MNSVLGWIASVIFRVSLGPGMIGAQQMVTGDGAARPGEEVFLRGIGMESFGYSLRVAREQGLFQIYS